MILQCFAGVTEHQNSNLENKTPFDVVIYYVLISLFFLERAVSGKSVARSKKERYNMTS